MVGGTVHVVLKFQKRILIGIAVITHKKRGWVVVAK